MLVGSMESAGPLFHSFFAHLFAGLKILMLLIALLPLFALCAITPEPARSVGRIVLPSVRTFCFWVLSLARFFQWKKAKFLGQVLSQFLGLLLVLLVFGPMVIALYLTWPVNLSLSLVLALLIADRLRSNRIPLTNDRPYLAVTAVIRSVLLPVAFGLCGVFWMQLFLNTYDADSVNVRRFENYVAYVSAQSKNWISFSIPASVGFACGLMLLVLLLPRLRAATRLISLEGRLGKASACLVCFSSFTFFSQAPFRYQDWKEFKRIQAEKRPGDTGTNEAALDATYLVIKNLRANDISYYRIMFDELNDTVVYGDQGRIVEAIIKKRMAPTDSSVSGESSIKQYQYPNQLTDGRADQAMEVIQDLFCNLIGATTPEMKGLAGKFIEELVNQESEQLFERGIRPTLEQEAEQLGFTEASERLPSIESQESGSGDQETANEITDIRSELATHQEEIQQADYQDDVKSEAEHPVEDDMP